MSPGDRVVATDAALDLGLVVKSDRGIITKILRPGRLGQSRIRVQRDGVASGPETWAEKFWRPES